MMRRFDTTRAVPAVLSGLLASAAAMSMAVSAGWAQTTAPAPAEAAQLPAVAQLAVRGKVGDSYTYKDEFSFDAKYSVVAPSGSTITEGSSSEMERAAQTRTVHEVAPTGNITVDSHTTSDEKTSVENGQTKTSKEPLKTVRQVMAPNGQVLSKTTLPDKNAPADKKTGIASKPSDDSGTDLSSLGFTFPDHAVHAGDTWNGVIKDDKDDKSGLGDIAFTAKLDSIEMRQNVPCAKVIITPELGALFRKAIAQSLPPNLKLTGTPQTTGAFTVYYALDRGAPIEATADMKIDGTYNLVQADAGSDAKPDAVVKISVTIKGSELATQHPSYDATLK